MVLFKCTIGSQQYLLQTGGDLTAFQCSVVEIDHFYCVKVRFPKALELLRESFFVFKPFHSLNIFGCADECPSFIDVQTDCETLNFSARLCTTQNVCPFVESSFQHQALQLFRIHFPQQQIFTNQIVDNLLCFEIVKVKEDFANGNSAQSSEVRTYCCALVRS